VLKELGQIQRAIKKSRQIVFDFPDNSWRFCQLALLLAHGDTPSTDDLDLAIGYTKKAIEHYPLKERAKLHELWAVLQAKRGYFEAAVKNGLVAMWTFDQDTRESLTGDASAEQLDAKIVEAKVGGGLLLSETNTSNLITPEGEALVDLNEAWTICFWLYRESDDGSLLAQAGGLGELNVELSDKDIFMHLFTDRQRSVFIGKTPIAKSKWQHIAITSDGTNQREGVNVFVDGKKIDVYRASNNNPDSHPAKVPVPTINFGACFDERTGFTAHSIIDEMRFYEVELLPENIVKVMGNQ